MIGMRAHDLDYGDIEVLSEKLAEYDKNTIQFALLKSVKNVNIKDGSFSPGLARYIKKALDKNDISISVLGCYINPVNPDLEARAKEIARFKEHIKYAKFLGADMIGTETGSVSPDGLYCPYNHSEENYQDFLSVARELVDYAKEMGVCVGIEAVIFFTIHSPETMKRMLDDLDSPNVFVIFDPMNYLDGSNYKNQREIFKKAFDLYGDRIAVVHCKDFVVGDDGNLKYVLPTEGLMDYEYLAELINEHKPHIPLLLEEVKENDVERITQEIKKVFGR